MNLKVMKVSINGKRIKIKYQIQITNLDGENSSTNTC